MNGPEPLEVLIVEDEILLATELGFLVQESGCRDVGHAMSSDEAVELAASLRPDLALVDVHLSDGPTGVEVARKIVDDCGGVVLFMTAPVA
jgi:CheY-like chemotaxis protein